MPRYYEEPDRNRRSFPKNCRLWCKGKVGREHILIVKFKPMGSWTCGISTWMPNRWTCYHRGVCERCGKILEWHVNCPDRVV